MSGLSFEEMQKILSLYRRFSASYSVFRECHPAEGPLIERIRSQAERAYAEYAAKTPSEVVQKTLGEDRRMLREMGLEGKFFKQ